MIDAAVDTGDFVEYGAARDFAQASMRSLIRSTNSFAKAMRPTSLS